MDSRDLQQAVSEMVGLLTPHGAAYWHRRAGSLEWSCRQTAAHVAHDLFAYAAQLAARHDSAYRPFDLPVGENASPDDLLRIIRGAGRVLGTVLAASDPTVRAWHWGPTDPGGFAALGVNEVLVHTYDIAQGLGIRWQPPVPVCRAVLARLFPDAPAGDPARILWWSTGRIALPGRPRLTDRVPQAALERTRNGGTERQGRP